MVKYSVIHRLFTAAVAALAFQPAGAVDTIEFCNLRSEIRKISPVQTLVKLQNYLRDKHIVFVSGLLDGTKTEFIANARAIQAVDRSVPITKIAPPRSQSVNGNVSFLLTEIKKAAALHPSRKILLIGMSKAGAEVAQLAAELPSIFDQTNTHGFVIDAVVPMNAAVGGSVFADLELATDSGLMERWARFKKQNGLEESVFEQWIGRVLKHFFLETSSAGFRSLTSAESRARSEKLVRQLQPDDALKLKDRLFFVSTSRDGSDPGDSPWYLAPVTRFIASEGLPNDGILFEKDQVIDGLGQHLLSVRKASHFSLTGQYGLDSCREDFTWYMLLRLALTPRQ